LLTAGVGIGCYYIGQERTYNKLQDCVTYGTFGISGGHYTNESFEKVDSLDFGPFRCLMMIKYDGSKIEWDYRKEYVRWDTYH
jgi:hypothetical protein